MARNVGETIRLQWDLRDLMGAPTNATVTLTITAPDGTVSTPAVANPGVGTYTADVPLTAAGTWRYRWAATGTVATADEGQVEVRPQGTAEVVSLDAVKAKLNITTATFDDELQDYIDSATETLRALVGRLTPQTIVERVYAGTGVLLLSEWPIESVTQVADTTGVVVDPTLYTLDARVGVIRSVPDASWLSGHYDVTYVAGWTRVPASVREAARIIVQHQWRTENGGGGLPMPGADGQLVQIPGFSAFWLPNRAAQALRGEDEQGRPLLRPEVAVR